jgi:hypothetical protein
MHNISRQWRTKRENQTKELIASPRVCQILLSKSCVLPTSKKICKVKRVHVQQFSIIHLSKSDLIYIRNTKRNKIMFVPFHLPKNLHQESSLFFISFSPSHLEGNNNDNHDLRTHMRGEVGFAKFLFLRSWFVKLLEPNFFCFAKIR